MGKPTPQLQPALQHEPTSQENDSRRLSLAPPPVPDEPPSPSTLLLALAVFGAAMAAVVYLAANAPGQIPAELHRFTELDSVYRDRGLEAFLTEKTALRADTSAALQSKDDRVRTAAESIAVYLFPDLLPEDDFERFTALELWTPLQKALERADRDSSRRAWFEQLRAEVWIYENPSRTTPQLSPIARQMLAIYDAVADGT